MRNLLIIIVLVFMVSCTSEKQAGVEDRKAAESGKAVPVTGSYALEITPKNAVRSSTLILIPRGFEFANARVEWIVNGAPLENGSAFQLSATSLAKGDTVQARALIKGYEIMSDQITIMNSLPEIVKIDVVPEAFADAASLRVEASAQDIDGDPVTFFYEWTNNGEQAGKGDRIEGMLKRGDAVMVKVTPFDGTDYGMSTTIRRELMNMRPVIAAHNEFTFDGTVYTYQVRASDPDGDTLSYSLEAPPNGMTIDPSTGLLRWVVPAEFKGKQGASITVSDGNGGISKYSIGITIQPKKGS